MALPTAPPVASELHQLKTQVLNLRVAGYALTVIVSIIVATVSRSERAAILALFAGLVLALSVVFRRSVGGRLEVGLVIDAGGAGILWWLFGPVAAVDFVFFFVVATAAFLLPRAAALRTTAILLLVTLAQFVVYLPGIDPPLLLLHQDANGPAARGIIIRAVLVVGATAMFFAIAKMIERSQRATAESEQRFRNLVEASPDAIVVHGESAILFANAAAADLVGALNQDDLLGMPIDRFVHADSLDSARSRSSWVLKGERAERAEMKLVRLDGAVIHVEHVAIPTTFQTKAASQVILRDITDSHLANQALQESEERYKSFFEGIPTPLYRTTPDGRILDANAALVALLGFPDKESLLDLEVDKAYVRPTDRVTSQEILHRQGRIEDDEQELIRYDGTRIWVRDTSRTVTDSAGAVAYYEGAMVDITQRKRAEDTTRRLIRILEATPDFVAIADQTGQFLYANQAARDLVGAAEDEDIRALQVKDVLEADGRDTLTEIIESEVWNGVLRLRSPDGSSVPASTVIINHRDDDGNIEYFSAVARDISARIAAEARLEKLVRSKDDFVASVSHELRTPLTAVVGLTQELQDGRDRFTKEEMSEFVSLIADQSAEVANIVEDLLVAARADIGKIAIIRKETHVGKQVTAVLAALGLDDAAIVSVSSDDDTRAWADATRVRQIIRNLLTNAMRYGGNDIELAVQRRNGSVLVTVTDDGPGIPEVSHEAIFEPYEQAQSRNTQPGSVGLGLTVSRQLARLMGGDLTYPPGPRGSTFELSLPAYTD